MQTIQVGPDTVAGEILKLKNAGWRFVTMTCTELDEEAVDILYHFDKDLELRHLRMRHAKSEPVPSISGILFAAMLVENEMRDQFALSFDGLVPDFNRTLLLDEEITSVQIPLANNCKIAKQ